VNLLYPKIDLKHLPGILGHAAVGALVAAVYGIVHDQITYSISPEYFTRLKFIQFHYADFGLPRRIFVAEVGVLATWWVGLIAGWFMARKTVPHFPPRIALRRSLQSFAVVFAIALLAGGIGCVLGWLRGPDADYSSWQSFASRYGVQDLSSFVRVAYIHNASYLGGLAGLLTALFLLRKKKQAVVLDDTNYGQPDGA
jgi:hypothetical protein